jgi:hypothetical protein
LPGRDLSVDVREEGIAVGTGPRTVPIGIRVAPDGIAHPRDHPIDTRAAAVEQDLRPSPEPIIVWPHPVDPQRWRAVGDTEPEDLVASEAGRARRLQGDAGVDREDTAPRHGRGGKYLDYRLLRHRGIRREPGRIAPRLMPRDTVPRVGQAKASCGRGSRGGGVGDRFRKRVVDAELVLRAFGFTSQGNRGQRGIP